MLMNRHSVRRLTSAIVLAAASQVYAHEWGYSSPIAPSQGWLNEFLRAENPYASAWNVGVLYWGRYEVKQNGGFVAPGSVADFRTDVDNDNNYLLTKVMPRISYQDKWVEFFVQGRHSSATSDERSSSGNGFINFATNNAARVTSSGPTGGGSSPESNGPFQINQAYINLGNHKEFPLSLKIGRQEFMLGEQRLVGPLPWNNVQRQWDAARAHYQNPWFIADVWSSALVLPRDGHFNVANWQEKFSGAMITTKKIPYLWSEFYFLARNVDADANVGYKGQVGVPFRPPAAQDIYTVGTYLKNSTNDWNNIDFGAQFYYQFGNFKDFRNQGAFAIREEHSAWAAVLAGGYTWKESQFSPRLGFEYSFGSGDDNPTDNKHNTFVHLYPTGHLFYGYADFTSLQNLHNMRLMSSIMLTPRIRLQVDGHLKWLDTVNDAFYNVGGIPRGGAVGAAGSQRVNFLPAGVRGTRYGINPDAGSFLGSELDVTVNWRVHKHLTVEANYSRFFVGDYITDSLSRVGSQDADYVYVQAQWNF
jgi:hypothetical protein